MRNIMLYMSLMLTILAVSTDVQASADGRLSAWLEEVVEQDAQEAMTQVGRRAAESTEQLTTVFLQMKDGIDDETLARLGCKKYAQLGDIAIVTVPLSRVSELAEQPEVVRVEANDKARFTMDNVATATNVLPVYEQTSEHPAFTGQGVIVGLEDVGFDLTHPTFYDDTSLSHYRIKAFWDMLAPHTDNDRLPVGNEWTTAEDILAQCHATDNHLFYHGTHTTGTAAGSGYDSPYRGMAWESDICLVANAVTEDTVLINPSDYYLYTNATDALGFKYIFDYAESQHKPCVVSFSEGYTPRMDGDDRLYATFLSRLTGPGRIFVSSAGNERQRLTYVHKPQGVETAGSFIEAYEKRVTYRLMTDGKPTLRLIAYQDKDVADKELRIAISSDGRSGNNLKDTLFINGDTCAVSIERYNAQLVEDKIGYIIVLTANRKLHGMKPMALVIEGENCEAELLGSSSYGFTNKDTDTRWNDAESSHNILAPGCFDAAITVGSTSHRLQYTNMKGDSITDTHAKTAGLLSWFSSVGPTLDGRMKPDVTAPGNYVISALSTYYLEAHPNGTYNHVKHFDAQGRTYAWAADLGTSMSTPAVAGIIALWLQAKPTLTPDDIRGILQRTCRHPEEGLDYPNNLYGYGDIDAYRGLLDVLNISGIKELSHHQPQSVRVSIKDGQLHMQFAQKPSRPVMLSIYTATGELKYQQRLLNTGQEVMLPLPIKGNGVYVVQLTGKDKGVTGSQLIRL